MRKSRHSARTGFDIDPVPKDLKDAYVRGPRDERDHAGSGITQFVAPSARELIKNGLVGQSIELGRQFAKASNSSVSSDGVPQQNRRGVGMARLDVGATGRQALVLSRPIGLDFPQLREIERRDIIIRLIQYTRISQVQRYCRPSRFEYLPGFRMGFKDLERKIGDADRQRFHWLSQYLMHCGAEFSPSAMRRMKRDNLRDFTAKHLRDSLTLDHAPIEKIPTKSGRPHGFIAVDGARVYFSDQNSGLDGDYADGYLPVLNQAIDRRVERSSDVIAVYCKDGTPSGFYTHDDLLVPIRNPTSDENYYGYGRPETEELLNISTALLNAFTLNARGISDNSVPHGILSFIGDYEEEDLTQVQQDWTARFQGAQNRFKIPTIASPEGPGVVWTPIGTPVVEQMYSRWWTLLVAVDCAMYGMDPVEINHDSFTPGSRSSLASSDTEERVTSSQDRGLFTLLHHYGDTLNEILSEVDEDVQLEWTGTEVSREEAQNRENALLSYGELRQRYNFPTDDLPAELYDAPLSAVPGVYMSLMQAAAQPPQGEGAPPPGAPGAEPPPEDLEQPRGPNGEQRFQDEEGNLHQEERPAAAPPQPPQPAPPAPETSPFAKAEAQPSLFWPSDLEREL